MCVRERESVRVFVCNRERDRERQRERDRLENRMMRQEKVLPRLGVASSSEQTVVVAHHFNYFEEVVMQCGANNSLQVLGSL